MRKLALVIDADAVDVASMSARGVMGTAGLAAFGFQTANQPSRPQTDRKQAGCVRLSH